MKVLNGIKSVFDKVLAVLGTICLAVMTIMTTYQVITRYFFNKPSAIADAVSQFLFVWMIMFGSAYVYGSREHLTIDLLKDKFPPKMNLVVEILTNIVLFCFVVIVCVYGGYLYANSQIKQIDPSLGISKSILYASIPFTGVITAFYAIFNSVKSVADYKRGQRKTGDPLGGTA